MLVAGPAGEYLLVAVQRGGELLQYFSAYDRSLALSLSRSLC